MGVENVRAMNRKSRIFAISFVLSALLIAISAGAIYHVYQRQRLKQDLIGALKSGDVAAEARLLSAGADANATDMEGLPVTLSGILSDYWQRIRSGKHPAKAFRTPALLVCVRDSKRLRLDSKLCIAQAELLLNRGANINSLAEARQTFLSTACVRRESALARFMIDRGADVNIPDVVGRTPLMWAAHGKDLALVKALLKAGANVNQKDNDGNTALTYAETLEDIQADIGGIIYALKQAGGHE